MKPDGTDETESLPLLRRDPKDNRVKRWWFHDLPRPLWVRSKKQMIMHYVKDYVTIFVATIIYLAGVCLPYNEQFFRIDDPDLDRPVIIDQIIPNHYAPFVFFFIPLAFLIFFHVLVVRHKVDFHHMILAFVIANLISGVPTTTLWYMVGGLRPDFLADDCAPDMNKVNYLKNIRHKPYNDFVYYRPTEVCMKKVIEFSFTKTPAFPSGHCSAAFTSWLFVAIYISSKIGAFKFSLGHLYKLTIFTSAICLAIAVGWTRTLDHQHGPFQIAFGTLLGIPAAFIGYRLKYCGVFSTDAHIPNYYLWKTIK
jgi:membrane-associated phospholipid phosphatase